jgi:hypothetical protein
MIPTAENVAIAFWDRIEPRLAPYEGVRLVALRVFESRDNFVEYRGERG